MLEFRFRADILKIALEMRPSNFSVLLGGPPIRKRTSAQAQLIVHHVGLAIRCQKHDRTLAVPRYVCTQMTEPGTCKSVSQCLLPNAITFMTLIAKLRGC